MIYPKPLEKGDCIGLAAPASPITEGQREECVQVLQELGFRVKLARGLAGTIRQGRFPYLAGPARQRAADINQLFQDRQVQAVFCVRGGYGSSGILPFLDYGSIRRNPKVFVGYSDITAIHMALQKKCSLVTFHGPMVKSDLLGRRPYDWENLWKMAGKEGELASWGRAAFRNPPGEEIRPLWREAGGGGNGRTWGRMPKRGVVTGRLTGGNLSVISRLAGTGYLPDMGNRILFLEDVNESTARIHMDLIQLEEMGVFRQVKGILLGDFTDCGDRTEELLSSYFSGRKLPVLKNVCSDHRPGMGTLPLGAVCRVDFVGGGIWFWAR